MSGVHEMSWRVSYADTDRMGVVYYANHWVLFERGRTELMRELGLRYRDLEERGFFLPVMDARVQYFAPAQYDDLLLIRTAVTEVGRASMAFRYELADSESKKIIARGFTKHPIVNRAWKPVAAPADVRNILSGVCVPNAFEGH